MYLADFFVRLFKIQRFNGEYMRFYFIVEMSRVRAANNETKNVIGREKKVKRTENWKFHSVVSGRESKASK